MIRLLCQCMTLLVLPLKLASWWDKRYKRSGSYLESESGLHAIYVFLMNSNYTERISCRYSGTIITSLKHVFLNMRLNSHARQKITPTIQLFAFRLQRCFGYLKHVNTLRQTMAQKFFTSQNNNKSISSGRSIRSKFLCFTAYSTRVQFLLCIRASTSHVRFHLKYYNPASQVWCW